MLDDGIMQPLLIQVCIYLGGGYVAVPEQLLNLPYACSAGQQMRRETVAERVRTDCLVDSDGLSGTADYGEDHHAGKLFAAVVEEEYVSAGAVGIDLTAVLEIVGEAVLGSVADRDEALLVTFAYYAQETVIEKEVVEAQRDEFRYAQPATVEHFDHCAVSAPEHGRGVERVDDRVDL